MANPRLALSRAQILGFQQRLGSLDARRPNGTASLQHAALAGLQNSMPRAALLSIHARVEGVGPTACDDSFLVQIWGPRFSCYVVAAEDLAIFSLGRLPESGPAQARAQDIASRLHAFLGGRRMPFGQAGRGIGIPPNALRYAAPTGSVLLRWDGARQPVVWTAPAPNVDPRHARLELARRYLHVFGPATAASFARWAGIRKADARSALAALGDTLTPVHTPVGDAWMLAEDEAAFLARPVSAAPARLLPSGDAYYLLWGDERELLVPEARQRDALWTSRVWPGALLVNGEIVGVWRRSARAVSIAVWRPLSSAERQAVEAEAASLPLHGASGSVTIRWG